MGFFDFIKGKYNLAKVGDIIVCIDDRNWNTPKTNIELRHGGKYKLVEISNSCCGYVYDINARIDGGVLRTSCGDCDKEISGMGIHWANVNRFRKATEEEAEEYRKGEIEDENVDIKIANAIIEENYELASELNESKNN